MQLKQELASVPPAADARLRAGPAGHLLPVGRLTTSRLRLTCRTALGMRRVLRLMLRSNLKTQMMPMAKYCYKKYHGADDGYDAVVAAAKANLNPPADFTIKPAPSPADIVANVIATTPDLSTLAVSDKEFILANGKPEDAAKVWDTIKGKSVQIPDVLVIESSPRCLRLRSRMMRCSRRRLTSPSI